MDGLVWATPTFCGPILANCGSEGRFNQRSDRSNRCQRRAGGCTVGAEGMG